MTWEVTYELAVPIPVAARVSSYPSLAIALEYDAAGSLTKIVHEVSTDAGVQPSLAMQLSERALEPLFETLEFLFGLAPQIARRHARTADRNGPGHSIGAFTLKSDAVIVGIVQLPKEATLSAFAPRFVTLLHLFNHARQSASDAEAVRLYYMIWEDLHPKPTGKGAATPDLRLKHTRDFVSHGGKFGNREALAFISTYIHKPFNAFDPKDPDHCAFVAAQRTEAFSLIEGELRQRL